MEKETGEYYYRARYYDPQVGRFLSEDPIGFRGKDSNLYRYAFNQPTIFKDPRGKIIQPVLKFCVAVFVGIQLIQKGEKLFTPQDPAPPEASLPPEEPPKCIPPNPNQDTCYDEGGYIIPCPKTCPLVKDPA